MELTRRDALVAVAASTVGVATAGEVAERTAAQESAGDSTRVLAGLEAAAEVVYPTEVTATESFLQTYILGREADREGFLSAAGDAIDELDTRSRREYNRRFEGLPVERREALLQNIGVGTVTADPEGTALERIRYYVVNELLFALYTSPTGGRLVGNENPPGYPGGRDAYQRGPNDE